MIQDAGADKEALPGRRLSGVRSRRVADGLAPHLVIHDLDDPRRRSFVDVRIRRLFLAVERAAPLSRIAVMRLL
jgi:hypothetical protein